ncbi:hypothetical protein BH10PLA2_BH10PLA2_33580 [soil metagenome]
MAGAERKIPRMLVPAANVREAAVVEEVAVFPVSTLAEAVGIGSGALVVEPTPSNVDEFFGRVLSYEVDFSDVRGQEFAKRAPHRSQWRTQRADVVDNFPGYRRLLGILAFCRSKPPSISVVQSLLA